MQPSQSPSPSPSMAHQQQLTSLLSPLLGMSSLHFQQPSSLAAHIPQKTRQSITGGEFVELDCPLPVRKLMPQYKYLPGLSISFEFWEQTGQCSHTPLQEKKPPLTPSTGGCLLLQFTAQSFWPLPPHRAGVMFAYQERIWLARHKLTGFAWLSYCIDFSLFVGVGTIFLMVAPFFALRPTSTCEGVCHNFNCSTKCSQDPCPFSHRCKICGGDHPPYQARPIKSSQTADVLQSYMYKPHTPTNVPFLHNLLKSRPTRDFVNKLRTGLWFSFWVVCKGDWFPRVLATFHLPPSNRKLMRLTYLRRTG